jgi:hypothetical protein
LFIGNSFTARNNLPGLVADLAAAAGKRMEHHLISVGGASLRRHWNGVQARRTIAGDHYDYVVLQEQSTLPIKNPQRMLENVRRFDTAIRAAGARPALYMTWARRARAADAGGDHGRVHVDRPGDGRHAHSGRRRVGGVPANRESPEPV